METVCKVVQVKGIPDAMPGYKTEIVSGVTSMDAAREAGKKRHAPLVRWLVKKERAYCYIAEKKGDRDANHAAV